MKICSRCLSAKELASFSPKQSHCKTCCAEKRAIWRRNNPDKVLAENASYRARNPEYWDEHYRKNSVKESERKAKYYRENKEIVSARIRNYANKNKHSVAAKLAKRRASLLSATPAWANHDKVKAFYKAADLLNMVTGIWHEVDHIVPLQGRKVCGLHWEGNLRVIERAENRSKGNSIWPDMP
jgi:hypothetical protein